MAGMHSCMFCKQFFAYRCCNGKVQSFFCTCCIEVSTRFVGCTLHRDYDNDEWVLGKGDFLLFLECLGIKGDFVGCLVLVFLWFSLSAVVHLFRSTIAF